MSKVLKILPLTGLALLAAACQNDSIQPQEGCDKCSAEEFCHENRCHAKRGLDEPCPVASACVDGLICESGQCKSSDPCKTVTCEDGQRCVGGECVAVDPCEGVSCKPEEFCSKGQCLEHSCASSVECPDPGQQYCDLELRRCRNLLDLGEACISKENSCKIGLFCIQDRCTRYISADDPCDANNLCPSQHNCVQGRCIKESKPYDPCSETKPCSNDFVCVSGLCVPLKGVCERNEDCSGDSYCCLDEHCARPKRCIPYGEDANDETCRFETRPGLFEAALQCEWLGGSDVVPHSNQVMSTIMVANLPFDSGSANEVVLKTFHPGVIRIFNGENCQLLQSIPLGMQAEGNLAVADLDNDGKIEILAESYGHPTVFHWDEASKQYVLKWKAIEASEGQSWGGPSIHDVDDDGYPEIFVASGMYDGRTGQKLASPNISSAHHGMIPVLADLDNDGKIEWIGSGHIWRYEKESKLWIQAYNINLPAAHYAYTDFGTPGATPSDFNFNAKDGRAEIVAVTRSQAVEIYTLEGQKIFSLRDTHNFGPPNVGDFDGDGLPEIGIAGKNSVQIIDPLCKASDPQCAKNGVLWESVSQDLSSGVTGTSIFDFDGDGKMEVIYGDECYTRVYNGQTGEVLFSSMRTSNTAFENPTIVDVDNDGSAEILMGSDTIAPACPVQDPNHKGVKCLEDRDCFSNRCVKGYCRCVSKEECNWQKDSQGQILEQYACVAPLNPQDIGTDKVCRATHPSGARRPGFQILRDRLDRWVSSRPIWNQHAYAVTHIRDDGSVPKTSEWKQNFLETTLNNFRQNSQGSFGAGSAPDITGRFTSAADSCRSNSAGKIEVHAQVCNRGTKSVGAGMPAVFYAGAVAQDKILCVSRLTTPLPIKSCGQLSCEINKETAQSLANTELLLVVNDDGVGGHTTVECNVNNNSDKILIEACQIN